MIWLNQRMCIPFKHLGLASAAVLLGAALSPGVFGQRPGTAPTTTRSDREMREQQQMEEEAEFRLRMVDELRLPTPRRQRRPSLALLREDYVRLQVINNDLAQAISTSETFDLKFVCNAANEIRKRASRLKTTLALPEPENAEPLEVTVEADQHRLALERLDRLVLKFVRNPIFRTPRLIDVEESSTAQRELEEIIELSDQIKKTSDRLNKSAPRSR